MMKEIGGEKSKGMDYKTLTRHFYREDETYFIPDLQLSTLAKNG
jgi:hypothetical protein